MTDDEIHYSKFQISQVSAMHVLSDRETRIKLVPTSLNLDWQNYQQAMKKFHEWFKKTKEELEKKYEGASGKAKINAAKKLIDFIREAVKKWEKIYRPTGGLWEGKKTEIIKGILKPGNFNFTVNVTLDIKIEIPSVLPSVVRGIVDNSKVSFNIDAPSSIFKNLLDGTITFSGVIIGIAEKDYIDLVFGLVNETLNFTAGDNNFINISAVWTGESVQAFYKNYVFVLRMEHRTPYISLPKMPNVHFAVCDRAFLHGVEKFDPMQYYIKYFRFYVIAIDKYRSIQFTQKPINEKHLYAYDTIEVLLCAAAIGHTLGDGIPYNIYMELRLIFDNKDSLYDKWFRLWFNSGDEYNRFNIRNNPGDVKYLEERFNFVLIACEKRGLSIFSDQPFLDFELIIPGGKRLEETYEPYYNRAVEVWKQEITNNHANVIAALEWIEFQSRNRAEHIFLLDFCIKIGLRPKPPDAQVEFERLGSLR